jgi:UPF0716 family protein affecting phage T7 exclusion
VLIRNLSLAKRTGLFVGAMLLIIPGFYTDLLGYGIIVYLFLADFLGAKKEKKEVKLEPGKNMP